MSSTAHRVGVELEPFLDAVTNVFRVMLDAKVACNRVVRSAGVESPGCAGAIFAVIGLEGTRSWRLAFVVPESTGAAITMRFLGLETAPPVEDVTDALGELANMVAGGAKAELATRHEGKSSITLPIVTSDGAAALDVSAGAAVAQAWCSSDLGSFVLYVSCIERNPGAGDDAAAGESGSTKSEDTR